MNFSIASSNSSNVVIHFAKRERLAICTNVYIS